MRGRRAIESTARRALSDTSQDTPHASGPSIWPIGFAIGVACLLLGLVISWIVAAIGAIIAVGLRVPLGARRHARRARRRAGDRAGDAGGRRPGQRAGGYGPRRGLDEPLKTYSRSRFLEASTIGLGAAIGAIVTLPVLGFMVLPPFTNLEEDEVDLGPIDNFPEGAFVIATLPREPEGRVR